MDFDPKKNYYEILGVGETASSDEIKQAFKKLAVKHHPDKKGWDKKKFQEINEAYQTLGDEKKKGQYDAYRSGWFNGFGWGQWWGDFWGFGGFGWGWVDFWDIDLGDIMGNFFWGWFWGWGRAKANKGWEDIQIALRITFEESYLGTTKKFSYARMKRIPGAEEEKCESCNGQGKVSQQVQTPFWVMQSQSACRTCGGLGKIFTKDGKTLPAGGLNKDSEIIEIKVPAGIKEWAYIKFAGKGNEWIWTWHAGDLYIQIQVAPSSLYERNWDNLYTKVSVTLFDLVLWGEISVDHPEGKLKVKIPKWTQVGDMVKVSGKGFGEGGVFSRKGDLYIVTKVEIPKKLSKDQEKLWSELRGKK